MARTTIPTEPASDRRTPEERWRRELEMKARELLAWYPDLTHASCTAISWDGRVMTAYAKREGPGDITAWLREEVGVEPERYERDPVIVAREKWETKAKERKRPR